MAHKNQSNWSPYSARKRTRLGAQGESALRGKPPTSSASSSRPGERHRKPTESFSFEEADDRVYDIFRRHGFGDLPHETRRTLTRFYQLLMENQESENFTRLTSLREVAIKHFVDSLMPMKMTELRFPLLDMGTGPGFPGVPLRVANPGKTVGLAEGVQRRVEFLKRAREALGLEGLPIFGRNVNQDFRYPFAGVITRAVEDARNTLGNAINCLPIGGRVYLMKGPNCGPEIQPALDAWGEHYRLAEDVEYELPETPHRRRLLVFEKTTHMPLPDDLTDRAWEEVAEPEDASEAAFLRRVLRLVEPRDESEPA